jgi:CBS domain-containing protein
MAQAARLDRIMTRDVETCPPTASVQEVARLMADRNVGSVPVADGDRLVGMITDRDLVLRVVAKGMDPRTERIGPHVSGQVVTLRPDSSVDEALRTMETHQIRRLPVCKGDRLVGIVSLGDLATKATPDGARDERVGEAFEEISKPSRPR